MIIEVLKKYFDENPIRWNYRKQATYQAVFTGFKPLVGMKLGSNRVTLVQDNTVFFEEEIGHRQTTDVPFIYGTPLKANKELQGLPVDLPFIYMPIPLSEIVSVGRNRQNEADVQLHILNSAQYADWNTEDYFENRLEWAWQLAEMYIKNWSHPKSVFNNSEGDATITAIPKWGKYDDAGTFAKIFDSELTGVRININLKYSTC
jgi:hypothetical protein